MLLTRRDFFRLSAACGAWSLSPFRTLLAATAPSPAPILVIYASGGWDPTMVFDPKIGNSAVAQESGWAEASGAGGLPFIGHASRPAVNSFFAEYGANAVIINGLNTVAMDRWTAVTQVLAGLASGQTLRTDFLATYASLLAPELDAPHLVIDAPYMPGSLSNVAVKLTTAQIRDYVTGLSNVDGLGDAGEAALATFRNAEYAHVASPANPASLDGDKLAALYGAETRETKLQVALARADQALGAPGTDADFVRNAKIALELFAAGTSLSAVVQAGADDLWETRSGDHFTRQSANYQELFTGLSAILAHADTLGLAEQLVVMVVSERGRHPRLNAQGGKEPWAFTSALLWGQGLNGTAVVGLTDDALRGIPIDPIFGTADSPSAVTIAMVNVYASLFLLGGLSIDTLLGGVKSLSRILATRG